MPVSRFSSWGTFGHAVALDQDMILFVTAAEQRMQCAAVIEEATGEPVVIAETFARATTLLREDRYEAAVFDENLVESEPLEVEAALEHAGMAIPVHVNLAISGAKRLARDVRGAIQRRTHEEASARAAAAHVLYGELNTILAALLLHCELAMEVRELPRDAAERLVLIHEAARELRAKLDVGAKQTSATTG